MARNVFISFLGTGNYLACTYHDLQGAAEEVRFVQEAVLRLKCGGWKAGDHGYIFVTDDACKKNWLDGGFKDENGKACQGLASRIATLELGFEVEKVGITEGLDTEQIWQNFETVYDCLRRGDRVVFDLTHAFRSIPVMAVALLNYARVMKNIELDGVYYGAFEVLGSCQEAKSLDPEQRRVPILDLTPLDTLMQWTLALDRFTGAGDAGPLERLTNISVGQVFKSRKGDGSAAETVGYLGGSLKNFTEVLSTCRGPMIVEAASRVKQNLEMCQDLDLIKPFKPLFKHLQETFAGFDDDQVNDGIQAARWCLDHGMVQQAATILDEVIVTWLVSEAGFDKLDRSIRKLAADALNAKAKNIKPAKDDKVRLGDKNLLDKFFEIVDRQEAMARVKNSLGDLRNDLNHAGWRRNSAKTPKKEKITNRLKKYIDQVEKIYAQFQSTGRQQDSSV